MSSKPDVIHLSCSSAVLGVRCVSVVKIFDVKHVHLHRTSCLGR
jgi:hypothetical protein